MNCIKWLFVLFLSCLTCGAATNELAAFRVFSANPPPDLVLRFTWERTETGSSPGNESQLAAPRLFYALLIKTTSNFALIQSPLPVEQGFLPHALFNAHGMTAGGLWDLNPSGQIHYQTLGQKQELFVPSRDFLAFPEFQKLLNLGIQRSNSLVWTGNTFQIENQGGNPGKITGELTLSNGLPASLSYNRTTNVSVAVHYAYTRPLEVPFPNEIRVDFYRRATLLFTEFYHVSECRTNLNGDDLNQCNPAFYINLGKSFAQNASPGDRAAASNRVAAIDQIPVTNNLFELNLVREYLQSNGVTVAMMRNGSWMYAPSGKKTSVLSENLKLMALGAVFFVVGLLTVFWRKRHA